MIRRGIAFLVSVALVACGEVDPEGTLENTNTHAHGSGSPTLVPDARAPREDDGGLRAKDATRGSDAHDASVRDPLEAGVLDGAFFDVADGYMGPPADANDLIEPDGSICRGVDPATLLGAPIIPPYAAAGVDLFGGPTGNCSEGWNPQDPSSFRYSLASDGTAPCTEPLLSSWICDPGVRIYVAEPSGDGGLELANEGFRFDFYPYGGFAVYYTKETGALNAIQIEAWGGFYGTNRIYSGTMAATDPDGTLYSIGLGRPIMTTPKGGMAAPLVFPEDASGLGALSAETESIINEIYAALSMQFLPSHAVPTDCFGAGECSFVPEQGTIVQHKSGPPTAGEMFIVYPLLHLDIGVRVLPGTDPSEPGNSVIEILLFAAEPSLQGPQ